MMITMCACVLPSAAQTIYHTTSGRKLSISILDVSTYLLAASTEDSRLVELFEQ